MEKRAMNDRVEPDMFVSQFSSLDFSRKRPMWKTIVDHNNKKYYYRITIKAKDHYGKHYCRQKQTAISQSHVLLSQSVRNNDFSSSRQGVRASSLNACDHRDPCQNGGSCLPTDSGPICECSRTQFTGRHCETGGLLTRYLVLNWLLVHWLRFNKINAYCRDPKELLNLLPLFWLRTPFFLCSPSASRAHVPGCRVPFLRSQPARHRAHPLRKRRNQPLLQNQKIVRPSLPHR